MVYPMFHTLAVRSVDKVTGLLHMIELSKICMGNSDIKFLKVAKCWDGLFKDRSGKI